MNLVVRQFAKFPVKNELRGFIYKGNFTALTQYNNLAFFPEHIKEKDNIERKVKKFMENFIDVMKTTLESFVADMVLDNDLDESMSTTVNGSRLPSRVRMVTSKKSTSSTTNTDTGLMLVCYILMVSTSQQKILKSSVTTFLTVGAAQFTDKSHN